MSDSDVDRLIAAANAARQYVHAPYSQYRVGAALLTDGGQIFAGCNVENASYGLCICAERVAVVKAISSGQRQFVAAAVVTDDGGTPCGACRQFLAEFCDDQLPVYIHRAVAPVGTRTLTLGQLLPDAFRLIDRSS